jgi:hypothetical protein
MAADTDCTTTTELSLPVFASPENGKLVSTFKPA